MLNYPRNNRRGGARLERGGSEPRERKEQDEERNERRNEQKGLKDQEDREKIIMVVMITAAVFMVLLTVGVLMATRWLKKPVLPPDNTGGVPIPSGTVSPPPSGAAAGPDQDAEATESYFELDIDPVEPKVSGKRKSEDFYTILVFGSDVVSGLTDTIMVVSYDVTNQRATVMSIPRDTLVNVRTAYKSINGVFNAGGRGDKGIARLRSEVSELIGFTPDYYVMIDWELVGKMVDAIDGVWFDIPYHMDYDDVAQDLYIHFDPGYQHLNGEDAMRVVRWRKNNKISPYYGEGGGGDTGRLSVQHEFLKAVLKQTLQLRNIPKVKELANLFGENVVSDLTIENLFWFGSQAIFHGLEVDDVEFVTMPYYGVGREDSPYNGRVYPIWSQLLKLTNSSLNPFVEDVTMRQLDLIRVNADDTLSSSTGVLADPSAAIPPVKESEEPGEGDEDEENDADPFASEEPSESGEPSESDSPHESRRPAESTRPKPTESEQPTVSQEPTLPLEPTPEPIPSDAWPEPWQPDPVPEPTPVDGSEVPDWLRPAV